MWSLNFNRRRNPQIKASCHPLRNFGVVRSGRLDASRAEVKALTVARDAALKAR
jgi:hypothetical protein